MMRPTFVLVAGSWHTAACFDPLIKTLDDAGYASVAVKPRCLNSSPPATSFQPDADALKEVLVELRDKDVILVMHSYGGLVGTDVVGDLVLNKPEVAARIKRLVYLAAFVPLKGQNLVEAFLSVPGPRPEPYFDYDVSLHLSRDLRMCLFKWQTDCTLRDIGRIPCFEGYRRRALLP